MCSALGLGGPGSGGSWVLNLHLPKTQATSDRVFNIKYLKDQIYSTGCSDVIILSVIYPITPCAQDLYATGIKHD